MKSLPDPRSKAAFRPTHLKVPQAKQISLTEASADFMSDASAYGVGPPNASQRLRSEDQDNWAIAGEDPAYRDESSLAWRRAQELNHCPDALRQALPPARPSRQARHTAGTFTTPHILAVLYRSLLLIPQTASV